MAKGRKCPCQGETLDRLLQPTMLVLLSRRPLSGYRLLQALSGTPMFRGEKPDAAGVYRCLRSMSARGLVKGAWRLSRRGPAQRVYELTPAGARCLARWVGTLEAYRRDLAVLLSLVRKASQPKRR
jgi:DNA-binding PadR family transcriptional regulator